MEARELAGAAAGARDRANRLQAQLDMRARDEARAGCRPSDGRCSASFLSDLSAGR